MLNAAFDSPPRGTRESEGLARTPTGGDTSVFRYFCPLCMVYFRAMQRTKCCANYICSFCDADVTRMKGSNATPCPYCCAGGLHCEHVASEDAVRTYHDSPRGAGTTLSVDAASPIRVGANFDELSRKLVPLPVLVLQPPSSTGGSCMSGNGRLSDQQSDPHSIASLSLSSSASVGANTTKSSESDTSSKLSPTRAKHRRFHLKASRSSRIAPDTVGCGCGSSKPTTSGCLVS